MTKEEIMNDIFSGVTLDIYRRASIEQFVKETDDLTIDNFMEKYYEWVNSGKNKKVFEQVREEILDEDDAKIIIGINAISDKNYTPANDPDALSRFKMDSVRCNTTGLNGLITADGEEIVPCIFDSINIHLDGFIEAEFKGTECKFRVVYRAEGIEDREDVLLYGKTGALVIDLDEENPFSEQLFNLLSK